jgi:hypothetical protein
LARNPEILEIPNAPWFTGSLISPSTHVTPAGKVLLEPYYFFIDATGSYNSDWKKIPQSSFLTDDIEIFTTIGITKWWDFAINPGLVYNHTRGTGTFLFNDLSTGFDFQLLSDHQDNYLPALKLGLREVFPIAKYGHLDSDKYKTDALGEGSYQTRIFLATGRLIHLRDSFWLNLRLAVNYTIPSRVHVRGLNAYGGASDTNAYVYPPQNFEADFAFELSLNQNWVIACDYVGAYANARKFKGYPGRLETGELADLSKGCAANFSVAPEIEYNWKAGVGIITGAWFSIAGRNSSAFASWVTAINLVF